jgi:hypothetical protein
VTPRANVHDVAQAHRLLHGTGIFDDAMIKATYGKYTLFHSGRQKNGLRENRPDT